MVMLNYTKDDWFLLAEMRAKHIAELSLFYLKGSSWQCHTLYAIVFNGCDLCGISAKTLLRAYAEKLKELIPEAHIDVQSDCVLFHLFSDKIKEEWRIDYINNFKKNQKYFETTKENRTTTNTGFSNVQLLPYCL